jgi:hypothetical protein
MYRVEACKLNQVVIVYLLNAQYAKEELKILDTFCLLVHGLRKFGKLGV